MPTSSPSLRIHKIELCNFRSFYGENNVLELGGKNLLLYGENGAGKTSLSLALKHFIESSRTHREFEGNIYALEKDPDAICSITLELIDDHKRTTSYVWGKLPLASSHTGATVLRDAAKANNFLDYKVLLKTYFLAADETPNLFDLLLEGILAEVESSVTNTPIGEEWQALKKQKEEIDSLKDKTLDKLQDLLERTIAEPEYEKIVEQISGITDPAEATEDEDEIARAREEAKQLVISKLKEPLAESLNQQCKTFSGLLESLLADLQRTIDSILRRLDKFLSVKLLTPIGGLRYDPDAEDFTGKEIALSVRLRKTPIKSHHVALNEARLSAIALAIYFASILQTPKPDLRIVVLDDVLIGLDLSHRIPVIELLNSRFKDYQIFLFTYDPMWYEVVKRKTDGNKWLCHKLYSPPESGFELTMLRDEGLLVQAAIHFGKRDYKAAAVYVRSAFEVALQRFCERNKIPVRFASDHK